MQTKTCVCFFLKHAHIHKNTCINTHTHRPLLLHTSTHQFMLFPIKHTPRCHFSSQVYFTIVSFTVTYIYIYLVAFIFVSMNYRMEDNLEVLVLHCVELRHNDNKKCFQGSERFGIVGSSANFFGQLSTMFFT